MKSLKLAVLLVGLFVALAATPTYAVGVWDACGGGTAGSSICADKDTEGPEVVKNIIDLLLFGLGATAVILIIHSGLKYTTSRGDPANVKSAKDTLLYAVIGVIVASLAYAIVHFVIDAF